MKKLLSVSAMVLALTLSAMHADAASIKDNMKQIKKLFKGIASVVNDPSKNAQSAADAAAIAGLFQAVETEVPESIADLPAGEQQDALNDYKSMIHHEIELAAALQKAFENGDNAMAARLLQQMDDVRKDGHEKYAD